MTPLDELLASYLDIARHLDPLAFPDDAPAEAHHRLGRLDRPSLIGYAAALRSVALAIEALEEVEAKDDEIDRTMLINTVRAEAARLEAAARGEVADPVTPLRQLTEALDEHLENEDFDAESEAALRDRVLAVPEFLGALREDDRPAPELLLTAAMIEGDGIDSALDEASERLDDVVVVRPALDALTEHLEWLRQPERLGDLIGMGEEAVTEQLKTLSSVPVGVKGALRILELRRAGVERSLARAAAELNAPDGLVLANGLRRETEVAGDIAEDYWADEWRRVGQELRELGLPAIDEEPPEQAFGAEDAWSMAAFAVRDHAARMLDLARANSPRAVRRVLVAPGLPEGWGRTVAALLRGTDVFGLPERRLMMSFHALLEAVAAEVDLQLQARLASPEALLAHVQAVVGVDEGDARALVHEVATTPLLAVATALAHEAWQEWYAEEGGEAVAFIQRALGGAGLAVPLARWASQ